MPKSEIRKKAGKKARDHGADFERRCARLLPQLLDHPHWKRTQRGDTQHRGDLVPCDEPALTGKERADMLDDYHIECKFRANGYTIKDVVKWADATFHQACMERSFKQIGDIQIWLLVGQGRGPVLAVYCDGSVGNQEDSTMIRCYMIGKTHLG